MAAQREYRYVAVGPLGNVYRTVRATESHEAAEAAASLLGLGGIALWDDSHPNVELYRANDGTFIYIHL